MASLDFAWAWGRVMRRGNQGDRLVYLSVIMSSAEEAHATDSTMKP